MINNYVLTEDDLVLSQNEKSEKILYFNTHRPIFQSMNKFCIHLKKNKFLVCLICDFLLLFMKDLKEKTSKDLVLNLYSKDLISNIYNLYESDKLFEVFAVSLFIKKISIVDLDLSIDTINFLNTSYFDAFKNFTQFIFGSSGHISSILITCMKYLKICLMNQLII
jgi:hypothetical protein